MGWRFPLATIIGLALAQYAPAVEDQGDFMSRLHEMITPELRDKEGMEEAVIVPDVYLFKLGPDQLRNGAGEVDPLPALRNTLDSVCLCFTDKSLPLIVTIREQVTGNPTLKFVVLDRAVLVTAGSHLEVFAPIIAFFRKNYDNASLNK